MLIIPRTSSRLLLSFHNNSNFPAIHGQLFYGSFGILIGGFGNFGGAQDLRGQFWEYRPILEQHTYCTLLGLETCKWPHSPGKLIILPFASVLLLEPSSKGPGGIVPTHASCDRPTDFHPGCGLWMTIKLNSSSFQLWSEGSSSQTGRDEYSCISG